MAPHCVRMRDSTSLLLLLQAKVNAELARECAANLELTTHARSGQLSSSKVKSLEMDLLMERRRLADQDKFLAALQKRYEALDVFKLDKIARRMKAIKQVITTIVHRLVRRLPHPTHLAGCLHRAPWLTACWHSLWCVLCVCVCVCVCVLDRMRTTPASQVASRVLWRRQRVGCKAAVRTLPPSCQSV